MARDEKRAPERPKQKADKPLRPEKPKEIDPNEASRGQAGVAGKKDQTWDIEDEQSWESFPASDPPSNWAGRDKSVKREPPKHN